MRGRHSMALLGISRNTTGGRVAVTRTGLTWAMLRRGICKKVYFFRRKIRKDGKCPGRDAVCPALRVGGLMLMAANTIKEESNAWIHGFRSREKNRSQAA